MGATEDFFDTEYERSLGGVLPSSPEELVAWAWNSLGRFEPSLRAPREVSSTDCDGYTRRELILSSVAGLEYRAYLLVPSGAGPFPGVLALHGHGYGPEEVVGLGPESGHHHFAVSLVKRGLVVLAPGVIGFGDRRFRVDRENPQNPSSCQKMASQLLLQGKTLAGLRVAEALGAAAHLRGVPEVGGRSVGLVGFSGGALVASWLGLVDRGLSAIVLAGFSNTYRESILAVPHCIDNYIPGVLTATELPGLLCRLAPQPLFLESGTQDPIFPAPGFRRAVAEIERSYSSAGISDRFDADLFPGVHEVSGRKSFPWLARSLR